MNPELLTTLRLDELAEMAYNDWPAARSEYHPAGAYLIPMRDLKSIDSKYGFDDGHSIVAYFLSNAGSWRGPVARAVKAELKRRLAR